MHCPEHNAVIMCAVFVLMSAVQFISCDDRGAGLLLFCTG